MSEREWKEGKSKEEKENNYQRNSQQIERFGGHDWD
jgi:hypothetical protein